MKKTREYKAREQLYYRLIKINNLLKYLLNCTFLSPKISIKLYFFIFQILLSIFLKFELNTLISQFHNAYYQIQSTIKSIPLNQFMQKQPIISVLIINNILFQGFEKIHTCSYNQQYIYIFFNVVMNNDYTALINSTNRQISIFFVSQIINFLPIFTSTKPIFVAQNLLLLVTKVLWQHHKNIHPKQQRTGPDREEDLVTIPCVANTEILEFFSFSVQILLNLYFGWIYINRCQKTITLISISTKSQNQHCQAISKQKIKNNFACK
eukprot:TRINITY_DN2533_c0_g3_i1.p1 TRINITY_DN2533_c0_g3~~TRINITY_DN2533_c0_g3_i1.p1  ORF type:complete len:266 (+),score=-19.82 TRINITY_DN2533_c0_g3_i1:138-935(+)